jgi:transcriptional regulator with XRE-family HTH domain
VPAGTLEAMRGSSPRTRVQRGYGWTSSGRLWIGYTLSQAVIDSHVVGVPSALKDELRGRFDLAAPNEDLGQLTTDGTNLWGLSRLLKRYSAEAGDALVLEFDLGTRSVHAFVGGQELLDPENRPEQVVEEPTEGAIRGQRADESKGEETAVCADDGVEEASGTGDREAESQELLPVRPALLDAQVDLHAEVVAPAADFRPTQPATPIDEEPPVTAGTTEAADQTFGREQPRTRAPTATLLEALSPGRRRSGESGDESFSRALKQLMRRRGKTFRELAEATDLSAGYLNHLVHGNRPVPAADVVERIAGALGIEPTYFREYRLNRVHEACRSGRGSSIRSSPTLLSRTLTRRRRSSAMNASARRSNC